MFSDEHSARGVSAPTRPRFEGTLKAWNDERGYGFLAPAHGADEVFVHIKAFGRRNGRPAVGQQFTFEVELSADGKKRAKNVQPGGAIKRARLPRNERPAQWSAASVLAIPVLVAVYALVSLQASVSPLWALAYVMLSIATFFAYAFDKTAAVRANWRTSESTLLALGLLGGWPGGLLAQQWLRHKSTKKPFRAAFWMTVAANLLAFIALNSPLLAKVMQR